MNMRIITVNVVLITLFFGVLKCQKPKPRQDFVYPGESTAFQSEPQVQSGPRISQTKCKIYSNLVEKNFQFSGLTLDSRPQELSVQNCDSTAGLVVGGIRATENEFPHMAAIGYRGSNGVLSFLCGASLISERFLLTAAHCQRNDDGVSASIVRLGTLHLDTSNGQTQPVDYRISNFTRHFKYSPETLENDIALIKVSRDVSLDQPQSIRPACVWTTANIDQEKAIATGWGTTEYGGKTSNELLKVRLDILDNQICSRAFADEFKISSSQLCAGVLAGGQDTCNGDSGGPIQIVLPKHKCVSHIIGVTSFGSNYCGSRGSPAVYTRVSAYLDWIETNVWS